MAKMLLPDVNVWLAMTFESHRHHHSAKSWFDAIETEVCFFSRYSQQGYLRLATNPSVFKQDVLTLNKLGKRTTCC